jgi:hypothetical protein
MTLKLRVSDPELERKAKQVDEVLIGEERFVAVTVDEHPEDGTLTAEEVAAVKVALADARPPLRGSAVLDYLRRRGREFGLY